MSKEWHQGPSGDRSPPGRVSRPLSQRYPGPHSGWRPRLWFPYPGFHSHRMAAPPTSMGQSPRRPRAQPRPWAYQGWLMALLSQLFLVRPLSWPRGSLVFPEAGAMESQRGHLGCALCPRV